MPKPERHVLVCLNARPPGNPKGSCTEKGAEAVFDRLKGLVKESELAERVIVNRTNCLKHCSRGVTVAVYPENVWYAGVTVDDAGAIFEEHLREGRPIPALSMPDIPWE
jgi:(2Fe-2S) ferredoxin